MNYTIEVTQQELQMIGDALAALPFGRVAALMRKVQQQVTQQEAQATSQSDAEASGK